MLVLYYIIRPEEKEESNGSLLGVFRRYVQRLVYV